VKHHYATSNDPLPEGKTITAMCGVEVGGCYGKHVRPDSASPCWCFPLEKTEVCSTPRMQSAADIRPLYEIAGQAWFCMWLQREFDEIVKECWGTGSGNDERGGEK